MTAEDWMTEAVEDRNWRTEDWRTKMDERKLDERTLRTEH
jgi:hypothetical protein